MVEARGDDGDFTDGVYFQIPETERRRSILNVREAVLRLRRDPVEVTLGKQVDRLRDQPTAATALAGDA